MISCQPYGLVDLPQVQIATLADFGHPLPGFLEEVYGLHHFLSTHFDRETPFQFTHGESGLLVNDRDWWRDLHSVSLNLDSDAKLRVIAGLDQSPGLAGHCGNALSKGATLQGDHRAALHFAREAIRVGGPGRFLSFRLVQALKAAEAPTSEWLQIATGIEKLDRSNWVAFGDELIRMIASGYMESGNIQALTKFIATQKRLSRDQPKRVELLNGLSNPEGGSADWKIAFTGECTPLFSRLLLDRTEASALNQRVIITGAMLAESPLDQIAEVSMDRADGNITKYFMTHDSPGLARLRPDLPHAAHARFKIELKFQAADSDILTLRGKTAAGKSINWLVLTRRPTTPPSDQSSSYPNCSKSRA